MAAKTDDINKKAAKLAEKQTEKGKEMQQYEEVRSQLQTIMSEQQNNLALEKQDMGNQAQLTETLSQAGAMAAAGGVGGGIAAQPQVVGPSTTETLQKFGMKPGTTVTHGHNVQIQPNKITVNNTYNNTTTNNISNGAGPLQGRPVQIAAATNTEAQSQARFKTWLSNLFAQQKEANQKRSKEYEKREWSLTRSANKMLRKMEATGKNVMDAFNPQRFGQTVGSQLKVLMTLFAIKFLAKNWDKIIKIAGNIVKFVKDGISYFGIGQEGKRLVANGGGFRGDLIRFLGGNPRDPKTTLLGVLKDVFKEFGDHMRLYFEKQMALRGMAMKSIKFPDLKFDGNSFGSDFLGRMLSGLGSVFTKAFSGVTTYLGDILTALVDPKAGVGKGVDRAVETQANQSSDMARRREKLNMFDSVGDNTMRGEYALEQKKYALLNNALDESGKLTGSAGSTISQGRDILGSYQDAKNYGAIDVSRVYTGLQRLQEAANKQGYVYLDEEFVRKMFPRGATGGLERVPMKYVRVENDGNLNALQHQYMMNDTGWGTAADAIGYGVGAAELVGTTIGTGGVGLFSKGAQVAKAVKAGQAGYGASRMAAGVVKNGFSWKNAAKGVAKGWLGKAIGTGIAELGAGFAEDDNHLELVPASDPRPAATVNGKPTREVYYYRVKPEAVDQLVKQFDPEGKGNREIILGNIQNHIVSRAGGKTAVNRAWNLRGKDSGYWQNQNVTDVESQLSEYRRLDNIERSYDDRLNNDAWSRRKVVIENNALGAINGVVNFAGDLMSGVGQALGITGSTKKITKAESKKNAVYIMNDLVKRGLQPHQAAGIVGNLMAESGLNPSSNAIDTNGLRAGGLAAWNGPLWEKLHAFAKQQGRPWNDMNLQLDYLWSLLNNPPKGMEKQMANVRDRLSKAKTPYDASDAWAYYERYAGYNYDPRTARQARWSPARIQQEHDNRGANANGVMAVWTEASGQEGGISKYLGSSFPKSGFAGQVGQIAPNFTRGSVVPEVTSEFSYTYTPATNPISVQSILSTSRNVSATGSVVVGQEPGVPGDIETRYTGKGEAFDVPKGFVALVGDSYAVGIAPHFIRELKAKGAKGKATSWTGKNDKRLCYCVSGATIQAITGQVQNAMGDDAAVIVIHAGLNNASQDEQVITNLLLDCGKVAATGGAKVFFIAPITNQPGKFNTKGAASKVARAVRSACAAGGFGLIDLEPSSPRYVTFDKEGIHPTGDGYSRLAKDIVELLWRGGGRVTAVAATQTETPETQGLVDNGSFFVPNSEYSPQGGFGDAWQTGADALSNAKLVDTQSPEEITKKLRAMKENEQIVKWYQAKGFKETWGENYEDFKQNFGSLDSNEKNTFITARNLWYSKWPKDFRERFVQQKTFEDFYKMFAGMSNDMQKSFVEEMQNKLTYFRATNLEALEKKYGSEKFDKYFGYTRDYFGRIDRTATQKRLEGFGSAERDTSMAGYSRNENRKYQQAIQTYGQEVVDLLEKKEQLEAKLGKASGKEKEDLTRQINSVVSKLNDRQSNAESIIGSSRIDKGVISASKYGQAKTENDTTEALLSKQLEINKRGANRISAIDSKMKTELFNARALGSSESELDKIREKYSKLRKKAEDDLAKELEAFNKTMNKRLDRMSSGVALTTLINSVSLAIARGEKKKARELIDEYCKNHKVNKRDLIARIGMSNDSIYDALGEKKEDFAKEVKKIKNNFKTFGNDGLESKAGYKYKVAGQDSDVGDQIRSFLKNIFDFNPKDGYGNVYVAENGMERLVWNHADGKQNVIGVRNPGSKKWVITSPWFNKRAKEVAEKRGDKPPVNKSGQVLVESKFAEGGWTGEGPVNQEAFSEKETTTSFEKVFHSGEYVVPKFMAHDPKWRPVIDSMEDERRHELGSNKMGSSRVKEPTDYTTVMLAEQRRTNDLLELSIKTDAQAYGDIVNATLTGAISRKPQPSGTLPRRQFSYQS